MIGGDISDFLATLRKQVLAFDILVDALARHCKIDRQDVEIWNTFYIATARGIVLSGLRRHMIEFFEPVVNTKLTSLSFPIKEGESVLGQLLIEVQHGADAILAEINVIEHEQAALAA